MGLGTDRGTVSLGFLVGSRGPWVVIGPFYPRKPVLGFRVWDRLSVALGCHWSVLSSKSPGTPGKPEGDWEPEALSPKGLTKKQT